MTVYPGGIDFPFRFAPAGGVAKSDDGDKVVANLKALVLSKVNERLVRKAVGTIGYARLLRPAHKTTLEPIKHLIKQAIAKYEPRAAAVTVDFREQNDSDGSKAIADVSFIFRNSGDSVTMSLDLL